jgi:hypothetical protein
VDECGSERFETNSSGKLEKYNSRLDVAAGNCDGEKNSCRVVKTRIKKRSKFFLLY